MIQKISRGSRMAGLMAYLAGPGRSNEHESPHIVAGDDRVTFAVEPGQTMSTDDALDVANILNEPSKVHGTNVTVPVRSWNEEQGKYETTGRKDGQVWHCSLSIGADEGKLSSEKWGEIAESFVEKMGFIDPDGAKSSRWVAVHHGTSSSGNDHIHLAVQLVREDGTKANVHNDFKRSQQAVAELEKEHGLKLVEGRHQGRGVGSYTHAEQAGAQRRGQALPARQELSRRMRAALATSSNQHEYVQRLMDSGVRVSPRFAEGSNQRVVGYRVGLAPSPQTGGRTIYYAPSKIDATLGWPSITTRFNGAGKDDAERLLRGIHSGTVNHPREATRLHDFDSRRSAQVMKGDATPDMLSNIYARVSLSMERTKPGVFHQLSQDYARAAQGNGNAGHMVRLGARMGSKSSSRGWLALLQQANRAARAMANAELAQNRPQLVTRTRPVLAQAEQIIEAEMTRVNARKAVAATASPERGPGHSAGTGYERGSSSEHTR